MFEEEEIHRLCAREVTFLKGQQLQVTGAVLDLKEEEAEDPDSFYISAKVESSKTRRHGRTGPGVWADTEPEEAEYTGGWYENSRYEVWIRCEKEEEAIEDYGCECLAFQDYPGMCKHCAAVALAYLESKKSRERMDAYRALLAEAKRERSDKEMLSMIQDYGMLRRMREQEAGGTIELIPKLHESGWNYYFGRKSYSLTFQIGPESGRKYVLKSLSDFVRAVKQEEKYTYGKKLSFIHSKSMFTRQGWQYVQLILTGLEEYSVVEENHGKELQLNLVTIEQFFNLNLGKEIEYDCIAYHYDTIQVLDENPPVRLELHKEKDSFRIALPPLCVWEGNEHLFVRVENRIYRCTQSYRAAMERILQCASEDRTVSYRISGTDMLSFCAVVLPELEAQQSVDTGALDLEPYRPKQAQIVYYLDEEDERVTLKVECGYGGKTFDLLAPSDGGSSDDRSSLFGKGSLRAEEYRDRLRERRALETARAYFQYEDPGQGILCFDSNETDRMYQLLNTGIRQLEEEGKVYATDRIRAHKVIRSPKAQVGISMESGLLELSVASESFSREELLEVLESYRSRKKYHRLRSGDFVELEQNAITAVAELLDGLGLDGKTLRKEQIVLPMFRACYLDQALKGEKGQLCVNRDTYYRALIRKMKHVEDSEYCVPERLEDTMREYQKTGYRWLRTLESLGFGGILADEMGLGKTLQTIAYLWSRKVEGISEHPSFIVCPASLVYNWERECARFAPGLKVRMIVGNAAAREAKICDEADDVWITSYDLLKRDIDLYEQIVFDAEVIDEAQNIKNQGTQAAKAVKRIHAGVRFALTGTPIENRLSELWSIFDYLMPGLLGTYEQFRRQYEQPIVQEEDASITERLRRMVAPFILRRLKQDVLKELPDKLEQIVYARMGEKQRRLYAGHAQRLQEQIAGKSREELQKDRLQILAELTRLRQLCCDPALIYEDYTDGACKVEVCMELVREAVGGGHKVLIFSQFTSIFPVLEKELDAEGITYYELTGRTPKEERQRLMETFHQDTVPVFLISLKAGGTGLNLTAASIVIHFDPWWNLAAQNQATDRAHRIGQQNQVTVFKLIAQNTVEEKIVALQEKKQELAGQILSGEVLAASALTKENLLEILKSS